MDTQIDRIIRQSGASVSDFGKIADQVLARQASSLPTPGASQDATSQLLPSDYTLDDAAHRAYEALLDNNPIVFLTGRAGTGKTTFIEYVRQNFKRNSIVLAPTGVAALNVGGQTIHSFFKFPPRLFDPSEINDRSDTLVDRLQLIIIDEISMVRADLIDHIDYALRKWRRRNEPFGGVQMLFVGDCLQLPPVVAGQAEREYFTERYRTPWFFGADIFNDLPVFAVELLTVHRQTDAHFVELLDRIRTNDNHRDAVAEINRHCVRDLEYSDSTIILTTTNRHADSINQRRLDDIDAPCCTYYGAKVGKFGLDGQRLPAPEELVLKRGAQVMVTKNIAGAVNGTLAKIIDLNDHSIVICCLDTDQELTLARARWEQYAYVWDSAARKISAREVGSYEQFPLMLGWAVTIHKSQGLSLDSVRIDLGRGAFAPGQTYVALSRCRSIDGIHLARAISMKDVMADPIILDFHSSILSDQP